MSLSDSIRRRRTSKDYDGRVVSDAFLNEALELANWAPNHKLNQPWRFRVLRANKVQNLIEHLKTGFNADDLKAFEKPLQRLSKVGALIYVGSLKDVDDMTDWENYAATCAAIQNILLYATDQGLISYWSTAKIFALPQTKAYVGFNDNEWFAGAIWLGYGNTPEAPKRKPVTEVTRWLD